MQSGGSYEHGGPRGQDAQGRGSSRWSSPLDWFAFRSILLVAPAIVLAIASLLGSWSTVGPLAVAALLLCAVVLAFGGRRGLALHLALAVLTVYQNALLYGTRTEPNVGIVWFFVLPPLAACLGRVRDVLIWGILAIASVAHCWHWTKTHDAMGHPLSLTNLVGVGICITAASLGVCAARARRERDLLAALRERAIAEDAASLSEQAMSRFLSSVSHEMRTPMTSVLLSAEMMEATEDRAEQRQLTQAVQRSSQVLLSLLDDVLDLAHVEAGENEPLREPFATETLLDEVRVLMAAHARRAGIALSVTADPDVHARYFGDAVRIRHVLLNLIANAVRHTRKGSVELSVAREGAALRFAVADTGEGIPAEKLEQVFEPFVHLARSSGGRAGTGLGLTLARGFVREMGGSLLVRSEPGVGSTFWFDLPLVPDGDATLGSRQAAGGEQAANPDIAAWQAAPGANEADDAAPHVILPRPGAGTGARCLVCDDDADIRKVVGHLLGRGGCEVVCTGDPAELEGHLRSEPFDLLLLDLQLGAQSGIDVLRRMRGDGGAGERIRVCMLSGSPSGRDAALAAGADAFVCKPPTAQQLFALVAEMRARGPRALDHGASKSVGASTANQ